MSGGYSDTTRVVVATNQVSCDLAGEAVVLNLSSGTYYGLSAVGARVWTLIRQPKTFAELRETLLAEYDVAPPVLESDLCELLARLAEEGLIEVNE